MEEIVAGAEEEEEEEEEEEQLILHGTPNGSPCGQQEQVMSPEECRKSARIRLALKEGDADALREAALTPGGLLGDDLREGAWPLLLRIKPEDVQSGGPKLEELEDHKDFSQVVLDVNRSLKRFPPGIEDTRRIVLQDQLTRLIIRVLHAHPELHYYQGYHDIAITFLLVVGEDVGFKMVEVLSLTHLRDFMEPTMERTTHLLNYIYPIIRRVSLKLHDFLERSEIGTIFCLPWLITWYGHTLNDYRDVVRLYDYFLAVPVLMPMYLAAAIVLYREKEILEGDCDMSYQHALLSKVPDQLPFETLLDKARDLYERFPPKMLEKEVKERSQRDLILFRRPPRTRNHLRWNVMRWVPFMPPPWIILRTIRLHKWSLLATLLAGTVAYVYKTDSTGSLVPWAWYR